MGERRQGHSKLRVDKGVIMQESTVPLGPITVSFGKKALGIHANGDLSVVKVSRDGQEVSMTIEQAISFAKEILKRCE